MEKEKVLIKDISRACVFLAILLFMLLAGSGNAYAWWNDKWETRKKIVFDTTAAGADINEALTDVPVCIRLHSGNLDFQKIKQDGADIRFVAGDDMTQLKHHFEWFDSVDELAIAWVRVPKLSGNAKQDFIWMYYGNKDASKGDDAKGTYDKGQLAVFHFSEIQGIPTDSTATANSPSGFTGSQGLPSILGKGISMNGVQDKLTIQSNPGLDLAGGFTFSAWVKIVSPQTRGSGVLMSRTNGEGSLTVGVDSVRLYCRINNGKDETLLSNPQAEIKQGDWHHVAVTAEHKGKVTLFIDGTKVYGVDLSTTLPNLSNDILIGNTEAGGVGFAGEIDEAGLSNLPRSEAWIKALYAAQIPQSKLASFQEEEAYSGGGSMAIAYIVVVIKNITPAGWFIIAITLAILAWCVVIFAEKVFLLRRTKRSNEAFEEIIAQLPDILALKETVEIEEGPLTRIYDEGRAYLKQRMQLRGARSYLAPQAMGALRFTLYKGQVRESQELTGKLVVMTIGIAGGPFLGLLGTVWGVMETFAAMAMVGEANIMAIAPGVASALGCTVVGLILAIPALFAYNYITTQIKDVMADISLFCDRFMANVEEHYSLEALDDQGCDEERRAAV